MPSRIIDKERNKIYQKRYREKHKEEIKQKGKQWRITSRDKYLAIQKRHRDKYRDKRNSENRLRYTTDGRWEDQLKYRFHITVQEYWGMYAEQNGVCKICNKPQNVGIKLDVDHDHISEKVRGLLCRHCNSGLGMFKDDPELVFKAADYLRSYQQDKILAPIENIENNFYQKETLELV